MPARMSKPINPNEEYILFPSISQYVFRLLSSLAVPFGKMHKKNINITYSWTGVRPDSPVFMERYIPAEDNHVTFH